MSGWGAIGLVVAWDEEVQANMKAFGKADLQNTIEALATGKIYPPTIKWDFSCWVPGTAGLGIFGG